MNKLFTLFFFTIFYILLFSLPVRSQQSIGEEGEEEILKYGFTNPLDGSLGLINKEINNVEELSNQIQDFFIPAELYFNAYQDLEFISGVNETDKIFNINYTLADKQYKSYSLFKPTLNQNSNYKTATVIIPGSGENQGIEIFNGVGYHGNIANEVAFYSDVFIAIKLNQDFLALHRSNRRLSSEFLVNYMLNNGGSYSVSYLVNTLATVKYLKTQYDQVFVIGLSQGGSAALLNSIQSTPDATVIASGFSVTRDIIEWANQDQIIIPNSVNVISNESIREIIRKQSTNYFFTWSTADIGIWKLEAENRYTCNYFNGLDNVECLSHNQGHVFPQPFVDNFLSKIPFARIGLKTTSQECNQEIYLKPVFFSSHNVIKYEWYRNDTLLNSSLDTLILSKGGAYALRIKTDESKQFQSKKIIIDPLHFQRNLVLKKQLLSAPPGFESYKWYLDGVLLEKEHENAIIIQKEGTYICCLKSNLGSFLSNEIVILKSYPFIINDLEALFVYPNPNNGIFKLVLTQEHIKQENIVILIYNELGQKVYENNVVLDNKLSEFDIDIRNSGKGRYFIKAIAPSKIFIKSIILI